jgi:23S rRNA (adenine2030-N6)-methyltransferase
MLSYQHIYHAGNLADVQKHALLAWVLEYLTRKDKPVSYIETHAGRGLYDLDASEARKTAEAAQGHLNTAVRGWFAQDHPYAQACARITEQYGPMAYPGSPMIAAKTLRDSDSLHFAELHPQEFAALKQNMRGTGAKSHHQSGFELAQSLIPPTPRRGILVIDPSYEIKTDYETIPKFITALRKRWNVGIIFLWYPILADNSHRKMVQTLTREDPEALAHEVRFPPAREGHRMIGSGLYIANPPFGLQDECARLSACFAKLN